MIMIEHRGVGMSRHDDSGADLPPEALTIEQVVDDVAAVLDDAQVDSAIVYGTSYGTYIAAGVGVRHPGRVHAMILDSSLLARDDIDAVRRALRNVLWHGRDPETKDLADKVRRLVDHGVMTPAAAQLAAAVYGFGGAQLLERQLDLLLGGRRLLWSGMNKVAAYTVGRKAPYRNETDLVGRIGYRELNYGGTPDGLPLDPAAAMREFASARHGVRGRAVRPGRRDAQVRLADRGDLRRPRSDHAARGGRAHRRPRPGRGAGATGPTGHSVLDTKESAALRIAAPVAAGRYAGLPGSGRHAGQLAESARPATDGVGHRGGGTGGGGAARGGAATGAPRYFMNPIVL